MTLKEEKIMNLEMLNAYDLELITTFMGALARCDNNARMKLLKATMFVEPHARVPIYENDAWTPEADVLGAYRELLYGFLNPAVRRVSADHNLPEKLNTDDA
jgi:hypothetical protein